MLGKKSAPRVILDPVHELIPFDDTPVDQLLWKLIDTREFQRLRRIKQLGVSDLVFPGATHTRFSHSIGVMQMARLFLDAIDKERSLDEKQRTVVLTAALLHDVGHGPYSHAFESIANQSHEAWTVKIIRDGSTDVHKVIGESGLIEAEDVVSFFDKEASSEDQDIPGFLSHVISSELDADRFDFLLRDSYATGANYGYFDHRWLIVNLRVDSKRGRFYLNHKARSAAEAYLFSRYHMYRQVYFHKAKRAAEVTLRLALQRYKELLARTSTHSEMEAVAPGTPKAVRNAFSGQEINVTHYLLLDDFSVTEFLKACESAEDRLLRYFGGGLLRRRLLKSIDVTDVKRAPEFYAAARDIVKESGWNEDYALIIDRAADVPYGEPYDPDKERQETLIFVEGPTGGIAEISTLERPLSELKKEFEFVRCYFLQELRGEIEAMAKRTTGEGQS